MKKLVVLALCLMAVAANFNVEAGRRYSRRVESSSVDCPGCVKGCASCKTGCKGGSCGVAACPSCPQAQSCPSGECPQVSGRTSYVGAAEVVEYQ